MSKAVDTFYKPFSINYMRKIILIAHSIDLSSLIVYYLYILVADCMRRRRL